MKKHHLSHAEEVKGGKDSHMHAKKMPKKSHHKKEKITMHDREMDRKNLAKARHKK